MADAQPSPQQILERVRNELQTQMMQGMRAILAFHDRLTCLVMCNFIFHSLRNLCVTISLISYVFYTVLDLMNKITDNCFTVCTRSTDAQIVPANNYSPTV